MSKRLVLLSLVLCIGLTLAIGATAQSTGCQGPGCQQACCSQNAGCQGYGCQQACCSQKSMDKMFPICHVELPSTDLLKSQAFYGGLFSWKFDFMPDSSYMGFDTGCGFGGGFMKVDKICAEKGCTVAYIMVPSVEQHSKKAEELGGKVIVPKMAVMEMGWFAIIVDPNGAAFGIWENAPPKKDK